MTRFHHFSYKHTFIPFSQAGAREDGDIPKETRFKLYQKLAVGVHVCGHRILQMGQNIFLYTI